MTANVGGMDKGIRAILGVGLLAYGIITGHWSGFIVPCFWAQQH